PPGGAQGRPRRLRAGPGARRAAVSRRPPPPPPVPPGAVTGDPLSFAVVDPRSRLVALAGTADARSLAEGALWIPAGAQPGLDFQAWLSRLDALGYRAAERLTSEM